MTQKYISWRRVSTFKQGQSGLGLEAQKEIIRYFIERDKGDWIADYSECYTGKELSGCVELQKAMQHAKRECAILVIAKSDRFRNCQEALGILDEMGEGHIEFCDLPHSDRFTLTLFWALAEREALITSIRTKQALAVKKAQGCKLGAGSEKYIKTMKEKTLKEKEEIFKKRGNAKVENGFQKKDTQMFIKILRKVFELDEDMAKWDLNRITSFGKKKYELFQAMKDFQEVDSELFQKWDLSDFERKKLHRQMVAYLQSLKKSIQRKLALVS